MKRFLLLSLSVLFMAHMTTAQVIWEDFEDGAALSWMATEGTFDGVVANPSPTGLNTSANVGQYTEFSAPWDDIRVDFADPVDLSVDNLFSIQVYTPKFTEMILKLEGVDDGGGITRVEKRVFVTSADTWREYTIDLSDGADNMFLTTLAIIFDAGVEGATDTYYFDNIQVWPQSECAGVELEAGWVDDFECQRFLSYGYSANWERLAVVDNPDPTGINTSATVGQYTDEPDQEWNRLQLDYSLDNNQVIDMSERSTLSMKIWSSVGGIPVKFKLEGGAQIETGDENSTAGADPITVAGEWTEYSVNFSDAVESGNTKILFFFNAGTNPGEELVYYIDDIRWDVTPEPPAICIENFEDEVLMWGVFEDDAAVHGSYEQVDNPGPDAGNESAQVGAHTKATPFSTVSTFLAPLDLSAEPQINMDVWAPEGATIVRFSLVTLDGTVYSREDELGATGQWTPVAFDFTDDAAITDFSEIRIIFDGVEGTGSTDGTFFFDNICQSIFIPGSPCDLIEPIVGYLDNFECQRNLTEGITGIDDEADAFEIVNNPNPDSVNPCEGGVGQYTDGFIDNAWNHIAFRNTGEAFDLVARPYLHIHILSNVADIPIKFKLELGSGDDVETGSGSLIGDDRLTDGSGEWQEFVIDFSPVSDIQKQVLVLFFNAGQDNSLGEQTYYIDNVIWSDSSDPASVACDPPLDVSVFDAAPEVRTLSIMPNPAFDYLRITDVQDVAQFSVYNLLGQQLKVVQTSAYDTNVEVNVADLNKGVYMITGHNEQGQIIANAKFVKH